jgi:hypothetical protein
MSMPPLPDPIGNDLRWGRRVRHGLPKVCPFCGQADQSLMMRTGHHALGEDNDPYLLSDSCRYCHARLHEGLREVGVDFRVGLGTWPERLCVMLVATGELLCELGRRLVEWGQRLGGFLEALDDYAPGWRDLPEAQP